VGEKQKAQKGNKIKKNDDVPSNAGSLQQQKKGRQRRR